MKRVTRNATCNSIGLPLDRACQFCHVGIHKSECIKYLFMNKLNETSLFVEDVEIYQKQEGVSIHVTHIEASTFLKLL